MRRNFVVLTLLFCATAAAADTIAFPNGRWFDGKRFVRATWYSVNGVLADRRPVHVDRTIDLTGKFVVPPFGEAHNHNVDSGPRLDSLIASYLRDGIFYVKNPNNLPRTTPRDSVNRPDSIDASFAMGSITAPDGHPSLIMKRNLARGFGTDADADGGFYFTVRNEAELEQKWPAILANKPDFLKTYLVYSEEYLKRRDDPAKYDWKALDPSLLPKIVSRAHEAGLRVSTHIETAADFRTAVAAGADEINHLPGFRPEEKDFTIYTSGAGRITDADARDAARGNVVVVTTAGEAIRAAADPKFADEESRAAMLDTVKQNLLTLKRNRVHVAIGSDDYRNGVMPEVMTLHALGIYTNAELLRMWTEETAATIFPKRKIGRLRSGYEASFLVLGASPIEIFENVRTIELRVKNGAIVAIK